MKGAVIASEATPDKNKLSTDTLTWSDIENKAEYEASSTGLSISIKDGKVGLPKPDMGMPVSGDADSTTNSAISPGTIEVRSNPNQDLSGLSRNTSDALNKLDKIFDKKTVQERQELAKVFGEVAFYAVGELGLKEGSPEKASIDALVGGIMSQLAGGSFASGAVGAGVTQLVMNEISKIDDPATRQLASYVVGAVATKLAGMDALTGGFVALSERINNEDNHLTKLMKKAVEGAIDSGKLPNPETMQSDYAYFEGGIGLGKFFGVAGGFLMDKEGNVYVITDAYIGGGIAPPINGTSGVGFFGKLDGTTKDYVNSLEGWSIGISASGIVGGNLSIGPGTISGEITATPGIGVTFGGRITKFFFNIYE